MSRYFHICRRFIGKHVSIRCRDGRLHTGRITRVTPSHVYLTPIGRAVADEALDADSIKAKKAIHTTAEQQGGEEILFFFPLAIPLAAILGLTLIGAAWSRPFWW